MKIKPSQIGDITLSFTDIGKSCSVRDFYVANVSFNAIRENFRIYSSTCITLNLEHIEIK